MAIPWGLVVFLIGILYGYFTPGREDKMELLKKGVLIGVVLGILFALIGFVIDVSAIGFGEGLVGFIISFVVLTILFVVGAWIGDFVEGAPKRT